MMDFHSNPPSLHSSWECGGLLGRHSFPHTSPCITRSLYRGYQFISWALLHAVSPSGPQRSPTSSEEVNIIKFSMRQRRAEGVYACSTRAGGASYRGPGTPLPEILGAIFLQFSLNAISGRMPPNIRRLHLRGIVARLHQSGSCGRNCTGAAIGNIYPIGATARGKN